MSAIDLVTVRQLALNILDEAEADAGTPYEAVEALIQYIVTCTTSPD